MVHAQTEYLKRLLNSARVVNLNLAAFYVLSLWVLNFNLWLIVRPIYYTSFIFLISIASILTLKHVPSLGPRIINWNLTSSACKKLYLNQVEIFFISNLIKIRLALSLYHNNTACCHWQIHIYFWFNLEKEQSCW